MTPDDFCRLTDRIARDRGLRLGEVAAAAGVDPAHLSSCRSGHRNPSQTLIVALRAVAAGLPPAPEET